MYIKELKKESTIAQVYENFTALAAVNVPQINLEKWRQTTHCSSTRETREWYGFDSIAILRETVELHGWTEGLARGVNLFGEIQPPKLPSYKRKRCRGITGHTLNMTSIYNGNFDKAWSTARKIPTSDRTKKSGKVNIIVTVDASCGVSAEKFFWRGAVGCMLAKALQKSGRNVALYAGTHTEGLFAGVEYTYNVTLTKIKDYGFPLELERLFAICATSGFYRYYIFKSFCAFDFRVTSWLGSPRKFPDSLVPEILEDDAPVILISDIWNEAQAKTAIENLLKDYL